MKRVANDAQIERLLTALKRQDGKAGLSDYGKQLAQKTALKEGKAYRTVERRFQRYITDAGERRSVYHAPAQQVRIVRQVARSLPIPAPPPAPIPQRPIFREPLRIQEPQIQRQPARELLPRYSESEVSNEELRAVIAYFDGDARKAGRALHVDSRWLDLVNAGTSISERRIRAQINLAVEDLYDRLPADDVEDIKDFTDALRGGEMAEHRIQILMQDLANGDTTFREWIDAYRNDQEADSEFETSEFWALWREAYARAKG